MFDASLWAFAHRCSCNSGPTHSNGSGNVETAKTADALKDAPALLFSGVGNSGSFHALAKALGIVVQEAYWTFGTMHYTAEIVERIRQRTKACGAELAVTTEKDAGKVVPFLSPTMSGGRCVYRRRSWWGGNG
ncbi:MAG: tetraacyldisaccharide 4'-kinase [Nitrospiraceae bacterium]